MKKTGILLLVISAFFLSSTVSYTYPKTKPVSKPTSTSKLVTKNVTSVSTNLTTYTSEYVNVSKVSYPYLKELEFLDNLTRDINSAPYNFSEYEVNVFDCSNMAALLFDWLKSKGYNVKFVLGIGWHTNNSYYPNIGHAWLIVCMNKSVKNPVKQVKYIRDIFGSYEYIVLKDNCYFVEPLTKDVFQKQPSFYKFDKIIITNSYNSTYAYTSPSEFKY